MGRHTNLRTAYAKGLLASSPQLTIGDLHRMTGVGCRTLARWRRELAGAEGGAGAAPPPEPCARVAAALADADRRAREAEEACCREHGVSHGQMEEARVRLARVGRACDTGDTDGGLLRSLVACRHDLGHTRRELGAAEALLALWPPPAGRKGRKTTPGERREVLRAIDEARGHGATLQAACARAGISVRTHVRWTAAGGGEDRRKEGAAKRVRASRLSDAERAKAEAALAEPRFAGKTAAHIVAALADEGTYVCSAATLTRIRRALRAAPPGSDAAPPERPRPPARPAPRLCATGPNQVWVWDITLLPTAVRGRFYAMFVVMDLFSRKVVAMAVHDTQDAEHAVALFTRAFEEHEVAPGTLTVHADNGSAMRANVTYDCLLRIGAGISHIRAGVSNDNAQMESLLRTLKHHGPLPLRAFDSPQAARAWAQANVRWYNNEHRHGALHHVTPAQRHRGEDTEILRWRCGVIEGARALHPERWFGDRIHAPEPAREVWINPPPGTEPHVIGETAPLAATLPATGQAPG